MERMFLNGPQKNHLFKLVKPWTGNKTFAIVQIIAEARPKVFTIDSSML